MSTELLIRNHWNVMTLLNRVLDAPRKDESEDDE